MTLDSLTSLERKALIAFNESEWMRQGPTFGNTKQLSHIFWPNDYRPYVSRVGRGKEWLKGAALAGRLKKKGLMETFPDEERCTAWRLSRKGHEILEGNTVTG